MMAFFKKELDQYLLTNKWLIFLIIFSVLGILNPFTAKITPALLENMLGEEYSMMIGEPTAVDAWMQFAKNIPQLGLVAFLLMMANSMSKELQEGTLSIFLAKGLKRKSVISAKLLFHVITWTVGYILAIVVTYIYTMYYWDHSVVQQLIPVLLGIYFFLLPFIFLTFLGNTMTNSTIGGLAFSGVYLMGMIAIQTFFVTRWNPLNLLQDIEERLSTNLEFSYATPMIVTLAIALICTVTAMLHFDKRAL